MTSKIGILVFTALSSLLCSVTANAINTATLNIDCGQIQNTANYRRGWVQSIDSPKVSTNMVLAQNSLANQVTATLNLNSDITAGSSPSPIFDIEMLGNVLASLPINSTGEQSILTGLNSINPSPNMPAFIQLSGTPLSFPDLFLDNINANISTGGQYQFDPNGQGNYYPLPLPNRFLPVQAAIGRLASHIEIVRPGNIWIGTQEPTHTLGYTPSCIAIEGAPYTQCERNNIDRYIEFWAPIAKQLRANGMRVGGVQLNSANVDSYVYAAQKIMAAGMPIDYFTIQRYKSNSVLMPNLRAAYDEFQKNPAYKHVKVVFNRYSGQKDYSLTSAQGMTGFLHDEGELMKYADIMYGYSYETAGLTSQGSLVPQMFQWLQKAPAHLRSVTFSPAVSGLEAFALVEKGVSPKAYIAIWNTSAVTYDVPINLNGLTGEFAGTLPVANKGGDNYVPVYPKSISVTKTNNKITGVRLAPNEFVLLNLQ